MNEHREPERETTSDSAAEMLAITRQQRDRTERSLNVNPGILFGSWGVAWLLGFGELYLTIGSDPILSLPLWGALLIFFACLGTAGMITGRELRHATRGLQGPSQKAGAMHGWSWTLAFVGLGGMTAAAARMGISDDAYALLWTTGAGLLVGVLFLNGGAIQGGDWWLYGIGLWILLVNGVGAFAGIPGHYLVMSLAGGSGLVLMGIVLAVRNAAKRSSEAGHEQRG